MAFMPAFIAMLAALLVFHLTGPVVSAIVLAVSALLFIWAEAKWGGK